MLTEKYQSLFLVIYKFPFDKIFFLVLNAFFCHSNILLTVLIVRLYVYNIRSLLTLRRKHDYFLFVILRQYYHFFSNIFPLLFYLSFTLSFFFLIFSCFLFYFCFSFLFIFLGIFLNSYLISFFLFPFLFFFSFVFHFWLLIYRYIKK